MLGLSLSRATTLHAVRRLRHIQTTSATPSTCRVPAPPSSRVHAMASKPVVKFATGWVSTSTPVRSRAPTLSLSLSLPLFLSHSCDALHALIARQEQEKARGGRGDSLERDPAPLRDRIRLVGPSRVAGGSRGDRQGEVSIGGRDGGRAGDGRGHVPLFQRWVSNSSQSDSDTHSPTRPLAHSLTRSISLV